MSKIELPKEIWNEIIKFSDTPALKSLATVSKDFNDMSNPALLTKCLTDTEKEIDLFEAKCKKWKEKKYVHGYSSDDATKVLGKLAAFDKKLAEIEVNVKKFPNPHGKDAAAKLKEFRADVARMKAEMNKFFQ
jgi:hypothetical protein